MLLLLSLSWWTRPFGTTVLALQCSSSRLSGMTINRTFPPRSIYRRRVKESPGSTPRGETKWLVHTTGAEQHNSNSNSIPTRTNTYVHTRYRCRHHRSQARQQHHPPPVLVGYLVGNHNQMSHFLEHRLSDTPYSLQLRDPVITKSSGLLVRFHISITTPTTWTVVGSVSHTSSPLHFTSLHSGRSTTYQ